MEGSPVRKRPRLVTLIAVFAVIGGIAVLSAEGFMSLLLSYHETVATEGLHGHCEYDAELGWVHIPSTELPDLYAPGIGLATNSQALRATQDYAPEVPEGRYRIVCLGDSFTMGYGVGDRETYEAQLEALNPTLQVVNMGMGGYGVDQCYLWYKRDRHKLQADALLFVVIRDNFFRMLRSKFAGYYPKPTLALVDGELVAQGQPLPNMLNSTRNSLRRFWRYTAFNRGLRSDSPLRSSGSSSSDVAPFDPSAFSFGETVPAVFRSVAQMCAEDGREFAVVFLPDRLDLSQPASPSLSDWLGEVLQAERIPYLDLTYLFERLSPSERRAHFLEDGHYTVLGNALVARELNAVLGGALGEHYPQ